VGLATVPGTLSGRYLWRGPEAMCLMRGGAGEGGRGVGERGEGCETDIRAARGGWICSRFAEGVWSANEI